jgi:glucan phosphoethanolaminetransferase (alkaline phosphatase superfamily)
MMERLPALVAALWWGSLTTLGFLVVPMLFAVLPTPAMAGGMAARLFSAQTWVSVGCGMLLMLFSQSKRPDVPVARSSLAMIFVVLGMLLALLSEFGVAPRIVARDNLRLWHGVGTGMYLAQWLCAGATLWQLLRKPSA